MKKILINKGDSYEGTLSLTDKGNPVDMSNTTLVLIVKEEGKDDDDAKFVQIVPELSGKDGKIDIEIDGIEERGDYVLYIKSLDGDKRFTLAEVPLTIK